MNTGRPQAGAGHGGNQRTRPQLELPAAGLNSFNAGQFSFILFNSSVTRLLNIEISALESDGKGKIIASPRVLTANQAEALIEQGTEIPYQQATSSGATSVSFRKANLALKVKPQITPDGNVIMTLDVNKDQPGATTPAGVQINTKHVKTEVLVENGGTVVIGGIYEQNDRTDITKIPLLGDLPVLGYFFRNTTTSSNKTESWCSSRPASSTTPDGSLSRHAPAFRAGTRRRSSEPHTPAFVPTMPG